MTYSTFVDCWMCWNERRRAPRDGHPYICSQELEDVYRTTIDTGSLHLERPFIFHTEYEKNTSVPTGEYADMPTATDNMRFPIINAQSILRQLEFVYTAKSMTEDGIVNAVPDFFRQGPTVGHEYPFLPTPFWTYMILFCPKCKRNIVFKARCSFMPLGIRIKGTVDVAEMYFIGCKTCKNGDRDSVEHMASYAFTDLYSPESKIKAVRSCLPVKMSIFGIPDDISLLKHDVGMFNIMRRDRITKSVAIVSDVYNASNGILTDPISNFI